LALEGNVKLFVLVVLVLLGLVLVVLVLLGGLREIVLSSAAMSQGDN
jgi:hypothetical protein